MTFTVRENVPLSQYTTLKVGGRARYFIEVKTMEDLEKAGQFASQTALPFLVLGGGSNLLISDHGFSGVVIFNQMKGREYKDNGDRTSILSVQAGEVFDEVIADTVSRGLWGLENLSSIPGTVGATPIQNVGAYGVEVSELIIAVETYHLLTGIKKVFEKSECNFGYRDSFFKTTEGKGYVITAVHFKLSTIPAPKIKYADLAKRFNEIKPNQLEIREAIVDIRSKKFPDWHLVGTAGSFFKNPIISLAESEILSSFYPDLPIYKTEDGMAKISLGYVLDKICNLKGYREGDVQLYTEQALVLVNYGSENADEIKKFAEKITKIVFDKTKIIITPEVCFID